MSGWPGQKVGGGAPVAAPVAQPAPQGGLPVRPVFSVPDPQQDIDNQRQGAADARDATRTEIDVNRFENTLDKDRFDRITTFRKEFITEPTVREFKGVQNATRQIIELANRDTDTPGPGDIALIISFMKALDPGSVVREGEFATAENAGGVPERIRNAYNKYVEGGRLSPDLKREFADTAASFYNSRLEGYNAFARDYRGLIEREGEDPDAQGIRLAEPITRAQTDPRRKVALDPVAGTGAPLVAAGDQDNFLTTEDQQAQAAANQLWASGAGIDQWRAFGRQFNRQVPFASQEELDAARGRFGGPRIQPTGRDPRADMGVLGSIGETITGDARSNPTVEGLADWTAMPELNQLSGAGAATGLGTLFANPQEAVQVIKSNFPGVDVTLDDKGNYILRSSVDGKQYAIKPGFRASDIPRAVGAVASFTPAGRATTLGGGFAAGAGTQAVIEGTQAATGGNFNLEDVAIAGAGNAGGVLLQRGVGAVRNARQARAAEAPQLSPMAADPEPVPTAAPEAPAPDLDAAAGANLAQPIPQEQATEFGEVAKAALGRGNAARKAKEQLAIVAQANPEAKAAAERLGIELPVDVIADDARLLTTQGLARSQIGSGAQSEWGATVRAAIDKSDATLAEIGASRDLAQLSDDVRVRLTAENTLLETQATALRRDVDAAIDVRAPVQAENLRASIMGTVEDLGGADAAKGAMSAEEKKLFAMLGGEEGDKLPTYAFFNRTRDQIGEAIYKGRGPWVDTDTATLKKYYGALAKDQIDHVESVGGVELADKMRGSNDLYHQMFKGREAMQTIFGQGLEKDIGTLVTRAIGNAAKGDAKDLRTVLAAVPKDMQPRTVLSALMARAERSSAGGGFSFDNYAKLYRGMRQNQPIYAEIAKTIGPKATQILQDLYVISSRMAAAEAKIVRTGASNQPILNALRSETLVAKTMNAGKRVGARGAGAVAGGMAGGPVGAAVGQEVSGALIDAVATGGKRNLDQLHSLLSSDAFRDLVVKAGTGNGDIRAANRLAADPVFVRFSKQFGLDGFDARRRWLIDAMTASPAPVASIAGRASTAPQAQLGALPLAAEGQTEREGSPTTGQGTR